MMRDQERIISNDKYEVMVLLTMQTLVKDWKTCSWKKRTNIVQVSKYSTSRSRNDAANEGSNPSIHPSIQSKPSKPTNTQHASSTHQYARTATPKSAWIHTETGSFVGLLY